MPTPRSAVSLRRQAGGLLLAVLVLPLATALMAAERRHLALVDEVLIYLVALIGITVLGGLLPAVGSAVAASLLLNWFFTPPLHRWTVEAPQNLLALVLFVSVAVIVSGTVDLAARRSALATRSSYEAGVLLSLARTVLGGDDTAVAVLQRLGETLGGSAELLERVGDDWIPVAAGGSATGAEVTYAVRANLRLRLTGDVKAMAPRLIDGFGAQAAAALDRERLRRQAAEAGALAEGNRIRTALLAAVGHDLRTPLASVKAAVSSLRQTDITLSDDDRLTLLATIEEGADRLDGLIGNLLDLSRLQTGSLDPIMRPTALDEVAPLALRGLTGPVRLDLPEDLPLVGTDPGLLERVLANVLANAVRYSPAGRPPTLRARADSTGVTVEVVDHGPGIPAEAKGRIFEAFQRLDDRSSGGVGLGLAVAKGFVEAMGGTLRAFDTDGGGLTMQVRLPLAAKG
ncbi:MAG: two-component system, OmpR family, sensor histidine kinase KdpD [Frankiales bacterium]|jgi:two-component system sensor histidine kinase KdpD|nr:two-component system, OmpR family, sensor histidine kinase KdpD [Frankiales bacterium]